MVVPDEPDASVLTTLTTKEGWRRFVTYTPCPPEAPEDFAALGSARREAYNQQRLDYLSNPITVYTPVLHKAALNVRRLLLLNRHQISARRGLIISGDGGTGKTTILTQLGRMHEHAIAALRDPTDRRARIPVIYITLPTAATPKMLAATPGRKE